MPDYSLEVLIDVVLFFIDVSRLSELLFGQHNQQSLVRDEELDQRSRFSLGSSVRVILLIL